MTLASSSAQAEAVLVTGLCSGSRRAPSPRTLGLVAALNEASCADDPQPRVQVLGHGKRDLNKDKREAARSPRTLTKTMLHFL